MQPGGNNIPVNVGNKMRVTFTTPRYAVAQRGAVGYNPTILQVGLIGGPVGGVIGRKCSRGILWISAMPSGSN